VFIFGCNSSFIVTDELLEWILMHETIFYRNHLLWDRQITTTVWTSLKKPVCIVTDGSPPVTGTKNEWSHGGKINISHCVMQQEVLCGKIKRLVDIWKTVVSYVNFVYTWWFYHGHFASFLCNIGNEYEDLPYYNEIQWLSCHRTWKACYDTISEIVIILEMKCVGNTKVRNRGKMWHFWLILWST